MSRAAFRKADIERAVQAVKACGLSVVSVEVSREGAIRVRTSDEKDLTNGRNRNLNEWDHS